MDELHVGPVSAVLAGIGGMGQHYLQRLLADSAAGRVILLAAVDPFPERSDLFGDLNRAGIPVFSQIEDVFSAGLKADLVVVSSPHHHHVKQSLIALKAGCHVLCEKPLAATIQDADLLIRETQKSKRWIRIGYQWSYSKAVLRLKNDILSGRFGDPLRARALFLWPRESSYYLRNDWAGRIRDREGSWVLDGPASSAMAHDLHNLLFLLGEKMDRSAQLREVQAELYRANPIENCDTVASRIVTGKGVPILFYASHAVQNVRGPFFAIDFEGASVAFGEEKNDICAVLAAGDKLSYGSPLDENPFRKLEESLEAVGRYIPVICGPEAARAQTLCVNGIQESSSVVRPFPDSMLRREKTRIWADGLAKALEFCYSRRLLPSEAGFSWGCQTRSINLEDYAYFPGGSLPEETAGEGD